MRTVRKLVSQDSRSMSCFCLAWRCFLALQGQRKSGMPSMGFGLSLMQRGPPGHKELRATLIGPVETLRRCIFRSRLRELRLQTAQRLPDTFPSSVNISSVSLLWTSEVSVEPLVPVFAQPVSLKPNSQNSEALHVKFGLWFI